MFALHLSWDTGILLLEQIYFTCSLSSFHFSNSFLVTRIFSSCCQAEEHYI